MVNTYIWAEIPQRYVGRCEPCDRPVAKTIDPKGKETNFPPERMINCPDCNGVCQSELLYGTINKMSCDARCEGAYGPSCVCACGGQNHSGRWEETINNVPAHVIENYRADRQRRLEVAQKRQLAAVKEKQTRFEGWASDHAMQIAPIMEYTGDIYFILDIKRQLEEHELLSPRQMEAANRVILEQIQKDAARKVMTELNSVSRYQGEVGDKVTIAVELEKIVHLDDPYTYSARGSEMPKKPMYIMRDTKGNVWVWYASKYQGEDVTTTVSGTRSNGEEWTNDHIDWRGWTEGDNLTLKGTIKEHKEYKGTEQTIITRCKGVVQK